MGRTELSLNKHVARYPAFSKRPVNVNYHCQYFICLWFRFLFCYHQLPLQSHLKRVLLLLFYHDLWQSQLFQVPETCEQRERETNAYFYYRRHYYYYYLNIIDNKNSYYHLLNTYFVLNSLVNLFYPPTSF